MDNQTLNELRKRVDMFERRLRLSYLLLISAALLMTIASLSTSSSNAQTNSAAPILRARGAPNRTRMSRVVPRKSFSVSSARAYHSP